MATTVEVLLRTAGGPNGKNGNVPSSQPDPNKKGKTDDPPADPPILKKMFGGVQKFVKGQLGLNFGVSALVKQSQIFTSTVGVIFQLLGALVDVILAPFLPIIIPIVRLLGKAIPIVQSFMTKHIAPAVQAIVDWFDDFIGKWDGSWSMFQEEMGNLWGNFTGWWDNTGRSWIADKIGNAKDWIGQKIVDLWDWFKGADTRVKGWIITFFATQFAKIPKIIGFLIKLGLKFVTTIPRLLFRASLGLVKMMFPVIGKMFITLASGLIKTITWLPRKIAGKIATDAKSLVTRLLKALGEKLGGLPLIGGFMKKLSGGGILKAVGGLAKASKAIPFVGAVATAGFGAVETFQKAKEHGWKAGLAYGTKTLAATGMQAVGMSAGALALDIGGSAALSQVFKKNPAMDDNGSGGNINITIVGGNQQEETLRFAKEKRRREQNLTAEMFNDTIGGG